jgi:DnaJ-class molecular chaperone
LGRMQSATTCSACNGAGQTLRHRPLELTAMA